MPRNIEIKARIESVAHMLSKVLAVADSGPTELYQEDTFFACPNGRLKLRVFSENQGELIFYERSNCAGPKQSTYVIAPTLSPQLLQEVLRLSHGELGRVRKRRLVFQVGRTRIHLDSVERLGDFLELEVCLTADESTDSGKTVANELMDKLGITPEQWIEGAYIDLLLAKKDIPDTSSDSTT